MMPTLEVEGPGSRARGLRRRQGQDAGLSRTVQALLVPGFHSGTRLGFCTQNARRFGGKPFPRSLLVMSRNQFPQIYKRHFLKKSRERQPQGHPPRGQLLPFPKTPPDEPSCLISKDAGLRE